MRTMFLVYLLDSNNDYIFAFDHDSKGYVFTNADEPELLHVNELGDGCNASPAIVGDSMILRTKNFLYRFQEER